MVSHEDKPPRVQLPYVQLVDNSQENMQVDCDNFPVKDLLSSNTRRKLSLEGKHEARLNLKHTCRRGGGQSFALRAVDLTVYGSHLTVHT